MSIVLIAASAHLSSMTASDEFRHAQAFVDTDALLAFQAITRQPPRLIVMEAGFAGTSRGAALIRRLNAEPLLATSELRVVSVDVAPEPASGRDSGAGALPDSAQTLAATSPSPDHGLPSEGTAHRAERFDIPPGIELLVDGNPAILIDLSTTGAQIAAPTSLKPNQRVRLVLPGGAAPIRLNGEITWAVFEMPRTGTRYRAGLEFIDPDVGALARFIAAHRLST